MKKKKILVTGSNGFIGQKVLDVLLSQSQVEVLACSRGEDRYCGPGNYAYASLDVLDKDALEKVIIQFQPDCVIHTVAMAQVEACEQQPEICYEVNTKPVQMFIELASLVDFHFIFLSTDFVFDGTGAPYAEDAAYSPLNEYGRSKMQAELLLKKSDIRWSVVRTVLVYGIPHDQARSNLVLWVKSSLEGNQAIRVVNDQYRMPTLVEDLALSLWKVCQYGPVGILHVCGAEFLSVYEMAMRTAAFFKLDESLITSVSSQQLPNQVKRPARSGFKNLKAEKLLGYTARSFSEGLAFLGERIRK